MIATANRFDALYRSKFHAGRSGWHNPEIAAEVAQYLRELLREAGVEAGCALELGCGTGTLSIVLARNGFRVVGLDISPVAVDAARRRWSEIDAMPGSCAFDVHDVGQPYPAASGRFDLVLDGLLLHWLTEPASRAAAARLAHDALRPHGVCLVMTVCGDPRRLPPGSTFDPSTRCAVTAAGQSEYHYAQPAELTGLFRGAGLTPASVRIVEGDNVTGCQDLYLAVLRKARPRGAT